MNVNQIKKYKPTHQLNIAGLSFGYLKKDGDNWVRFCCENHGYIQFIDENKLIPMFLMEL